MLGCQVIKVGFICNLATSGRRQGADEKTSVFFNCYNFMWLLRVFQQYLYVSNKRHRLLGALGHSKTFTGLVHVCFVSEICLRGECTINFIARIRNMLYILIFRGEMWRQGLNSSNSSTGYTAPGEKFGSSSRGKLTLRLRLPNTFNKKIIIFI